MDGFSTFTFWTFGSVFGLWEWDRLLMVWPRLTQVFLLISQSSLYTNVLVYISAGTRRLTYPNHIYPYKQADTPSSCRWYKIKVHFPHNKQPLSIARWFIIQEYSPQIENGIRPESTNLSTSTYTLRIYVFDGYKLAFY